MKYIAINNFPVAGFRNTLPVSAICIFLCKTCQQAIALFSFKFNTRGCIFTSLITPPCAHNRKQDKTAGTSKRITA